MTIGLQPPYENAHTVQPTIEQNEKTAAQDIAKFRLGLVSDTLDNRPFTEVDKNNLWKYNSNTPFLVAPSKGKNRVGGAEETSSDAETQAEINNIILKSGISQETLDKLAEMNRLTDEERDPKKFPNYELFYNFNQTFVLCAETAVHIDRASTNQDTENAANEAFASQSLPQVVSDNIKTVTDEFVQAAKALLSELGPNFVGYDELNQNVDQLKEGVHG